MRFNKKIIASLVTCMIIVFIAVNFNTFYNGLINRFENKGQNCGTIRVQARNGDQYFLEANDLAAENTESCMAQAFQSCSPAYFVLNQQGVDTGSSSTYVIKHYSTSQCTIRQESSSYSANFGGSSHTYTSECSNIKQDNRGFLIACQDHDLLISPSGSPEIPNSQF